MPKAKSKSHSTATYVGCVLGGLGLVVAGFFAGLQFQGSNKPVPPTDFSGIYEWQWAGENWYGKVKLSEKNTISQARVGILNKLNAPDGSTTFEISNDVIELVEGSYKQKGRSRVKIDMLVKKRVTGEYPELQQTIQGILEERRCLAGQVEYNDHLTGDNYVGDMILVDYCSHLGDDVATWCATAN